MKTLFHPIFLVSVFLALINQFLERQGIVLPFVHSYLDDFLCFPIVLTVGLAAYRIIIPNYTLTAWHIWPLFIVYALIFEWYLPQTSAIYTADFFDLVAYFVGILIFKKWINQRPQSLQVVKRFRLEKE